MATRTDKVTTTTCDYCKEPIRTDLRTDFYRLEVLSYDDDEHCYLVSHTEDLHATCMLKRGAGAVSGG